MEKRKVIVGGNTPIPEELLNAINKVFGVEPTVIAPDSEDEPEKDEYADMREEAHECAMAIRFLYDALIDVGFGEKQAYGLVRSYFN